MELPFGIASIEHFTLIFIRVSAALAVLPIFKHKSIPSSLKAGLALALTFLIAPSIPQTTFAKTGTIADYLLMGMSETVCGLLMGFAGQFIFYAIEICGRILGLQSGLSIVSTIDPNLEGQSDVLTQIYEMLAILVFLSIDGHLMMLQTLRASFDTIAVGSLSLDGKLAEWSVNQAGIVLGRGIQLAAPMMVTLFLSDVALGILTRVAPTMNVFVLGFPLKIGITLMFAALTASTVASIFANQYRDFAIELPAFLRVLSGN
jgi:flagellar biosynthetic protein FliR